MNIVYSDTSHFEVHELESLFLSVGWESGFYGQRLVEAMKGCATVYSAWDGEELVGLAEVLDDGAMNAYLHYLLVKPEYQKCGIGRELLNRVKDKYKNYTNLILIAYAEKEEFYRCCGFESGKDKIPMFCIALNVPER
jgi:GNAT superfamily N-acetyltransferase